LVCDGEECWVKEAGEAARLGSMHTTPLPVAGKTSVSPEQLTHTHPPTHHTPHTPTRKDMAYVCSVITRKMIPT
jgi:hypothetical protein